MEQNDSSSPNSENGLDLQPLSPDEDFANVIKILFDSANDLTKEQKKDYLAKRCPNELTKLNFATVMDLYPDDDDHLIVTDLLLAIASKATNMSDFQIMDDSENTTLRSMREDMVSAIAKMTKLEVLAVEKFSISFSSLMKLSGKLPSLKTLYFKIEAEPNFEIDDLDVFKKSFGHLEIFQFSSVSNKGEWDEKFRESLTLGCIRYLPNLTLLGDPDYFLDMLTTCLYYESLATTDQSKLTKLVFSVDRDIQTNALSKFPDVNHLHINWEDKNEPSNGYRVPALLEFKELFVLGLNDLGTNYSVYLKQFLEVYGKSLKKLRLSFKSPIDFVRLFFFYCNSFDNLRELLMVDVDVEPFTVTEEGKRGNCQLDCVVHQHFGKGFCQSLKHLHFEFASKQSSNQTYVHLSKILSVPNLETVTLRSVPTNLDELWKTMILVAKRTILKNVIYFELELFDEDMIENEIIAITRCCQSIKNELLSGKEEGEIIVVVTPLCRPQNKT